MVLQLFRCLRTCIQGRGQGAAGRREETQPPLAGADGRHEATVPEALQSLLDIQGIGPKTVRYLYEGGFTTIAQIRAASEEELASVEGVGQRAAAILKRSLTPQ